MNCTVYVRQSEVISLYKQFNRCAEYAKQNGYSISGKILDFDGKHFHEAVNKVVASDDIKRLIVFDQNKIFNSLDDILFYRIYLEKLGKKLISCN